MFFSNANVREEFALDEHYVGHVCNHSTPSFRVVVDCYEGYMVLVCARDEEHPKPIQLVKALPSPNFVRTNPKIHQIEMEFCQLSTKDQNLLYTYLGWDTKKGFKWKIDLAYGPVWINIDTMLRVWKPHKGSKSKTMTIPKIHIEFAKDILARIATRENNIKNGYEVEDGDGHE